MANKPRKAFDGIGRPAGIIDDVIYPIASKIVRKRIDKTVKGSTVRSFANYNKARKLDKKIDTRRVDSYVDKSNKLYRKELEFGKSAKQITKSANKREVLEAKIGGVRRQDVTKGDYWGGPRSRAPEVRRRQTKRGTGPLGTKR